MPDLPEVTQEWDANVAPYVAAMAEMIDATKAARDEALAAIAQIQAALDALHGGDLNIDVNAAGVAEVAAATDAAAAAEDRLAEATARVAAGERIENAEAIDLIASRAKFAAADGAAASADRDLASASLEAAAGASQLSDAQAVAVVRKMAEVGAARAAAGADMDLAESSVLVAASTHTASDALRGIIGAMNPASAATRIFGLSWNALHWILGVSVETLAVLIPAIIAFGAGLDVAMQGAVNAAGHMQALWTAAEATGAAFHQTLGTLLGLKPALQAAQDAANPGVYEILGSAVNDAKAHMASLATAGLGVVHMWDEFSARITVDMQQMAKSGEMQSLLGNMVADLQMLGQVFGNVGHAILNFAADMPGLAEVLLMIVDDISKVILWVSELPRPIIFAAMAMEEFYRWGGLLASVIARIGLVLPAIGPALLGAPIALFGRLSAIMGSVVGVGAQLAGVGASMAGGIAKVIPAASGAEKALSGMSSEMASMASDTAMMGEFGLAIVAMGALAYAISRVKDADEQMAASAEKAVKAASDLNVTTVIAQNLVTLAHASDQANSSLGHMSSGMQTAGAAVNMYSAASGVGLEGAMKVTNSFAQSVSNGSQIISSAVPGFGALAGAAAHLWASFSGASKATSDTVALTGAQQSLIGTFHTVSGNLSYLSSAYHISGAAAAALAQEAGVNLQMSLRGSGQAAEIARQQIANLVQGLGAMSAPAGVVGNDMEALGIQSQLAGTKVQQLNQAWDAWMSSVTGSMAAFSQVQTAIGTMAQDAAAKSASLSGSIGSVALAGSTMTYTLKGMGQNAMQSWQQLTSALGQGNSALDQLRTGMAEGVISGGQFGSTVKGLVGEMIPFVAGNRTAIEMLSNLGHEAGGPVTQSLKQLEEWAGVKGKAAADQFSKGMNDASQAMGNMSKVAQNLSAVVSSDLDQALAASITKTSGVSAAVQKYSQDLANSNTPASQLHADVQAISTAMATEQRMTAQAAQGINQAGNAASVAGGKFHLAAGAIDSYISALDHIPSRVETSVITNYVSTGYSGPGGVGHRVGAHGGMVTGTGIIPSFAGGGALPGFSPGVDSILAALSPGEGVLTPYALRMIGGAPALNWLNSMAEHGSAPAGGAATGGGAGAGGAEPVNHMHVYLDGKQIWESMQERTLTYGTRNSGARTGSWAPGR